MGAVAGHADGADPDPGGVPDVPFGGAGRCRRVCCWRWTASTWCCRVPRCSTSSWGSSCWPSFAALVLDRDTQRRRWLRALENGFDPATRSRLPFRFAESVPWWRLVAGGPAGLRHRGEVERGVLRAVLPGPGGGRGRSTPAGPPGCAGASWSGLLADFGWLVLAPVCSSTVTYLAPGPAGSSPTPGTSGTGGPTTARPRQPVLGALLNLVHYHPEAFKFHNGLDDKHVYQSWPWQWLLLGRPVAFYWSGSGGCGAPTCAAEILLLGTPLLWWSFLPALAALAWFGIARRDWRAFAIGTVVAGGMLPWFWYAVTEGRTMFSFYVLPAVPFLVLAVVYVLGAIMTPPTGLVHGPRAHATGNLSAPSSPGSYVLLVAACFAYFYPVFVGHLIPYGDWSARMWLGSRWI